MNFNSKRLMVAGASLLASFITVFLGLPWEQSATLSAAIFGISASYILAETYRPSGTFTSFEIDKSLVELQKEAKTASKDDVDEHIKQVIKLVKFDSASLVKSGEDKHNT